MPTPGPPPPPPLPPPHPTWSYLAESGCAAMCVNLCKAPVQAFFTEQLGMPLLMTPNYETLGCELVFGAVPPPLEEDVALSTPCLAGCPSSAGGGGVCPKLGGGEGGAGRCVQ